MKISDISYVKIELSGKQMLLALPCLHENNLYMLMVPAWKYLVMQKIWMKTSILHLGCQDKPSCTHWYRQDENILDINMSVMTMSSLTCPWFPSLTKRILSQCESNFKLLLCCRVLVIPSPVQLNCCGTDESEQSCQTECWTHSSLEHCFWWSEVLRINIWINKSWSWDAEASFLTQFTKAEKMEKKETEHWKIFIVKIYKFKVNELKKI